MTALTANITATQTLIPVDAGLTNGSFQLPLYYTVDSEAVRVTGRAHRTTWLVERGIAGTTAATHSSAATLTRYYPEAASSEAGGAGVTVDNQSDPPAEVTTLVAPGADLSTPGEATLAEGGILRAIVTLTDAQIKALPTTPVEVIPAQGAGQVIWPIFATARLQWTADYTNIHAGATLSFKAQGASDVTTYLTNEFFNFVSGLLAGGWHAHAIFTAVQRVNVGADFVVADSGWYDEDLVNLALDFSMTNIDGNLTGGDPANSLKLTIFYAVVSV